jgi:carboxymethylenebutenolidase
MPGRFIIVRAEDGGEFRAYLATPERGSGPGLVLLQEIFGVNPYMRDVADRYAEEGYVAVCPDLFWRIEPGVELSQSDADREKAFALAAKFDVAKGVEDIKSTVERLRGLPECKGRIGALGFCLGGKLAYLAAAKAGIDVAVSYYGVGIEKALELAPEISCPLVFHFAERDEHVPAAADGARRRPVDGDVRVARAAALDVEAEAVEPHAGLPDRGGGADPGGERWQEERGGGERDRPAASTTNRRCDL